MLRVLLTHFHRALGMLQLVTEQAQAVKEEEAGQVRPSSWVVLGTKRKRVSIAHL